MNRETKATHLLPMMDLAEAQQRQFHLVEVIARHFQGEEMFQRGDVGLHPAEKRPRFTARVEKVLAEVFGAEDAVLVRGAGSGAIRSLLGALLTPGASLFLHRAPVYTTTEETLRLFQLRPVYIDYNDRKEVRQAIKEHPECRLFYIQHARQQPADVYDPGGLIREVRRVRPEMILVTDDNYCVFKVPRIGVELGADYTAFSGFKLLGPEGVGVVVGREANVSEIRRRNYSGGGQVQGWEAMDLLRSLVWAPISLAVQNKQTDQLCRRLETGEVPGVARVWMSNSQSKNVIVEWKAPVASQVIAASEKYGAAVYPVGAESRYEILPMIYRVSGSFLQARPELAERGIRINPMKAGADTVIRILRQAVAEVSAIF